MKNLKFSDDKLWIRYSNHPINIFKKVISIPYQDITKMSEVKSDFKMVIIFISIVLMYLGFHFLDNLGASLFLSGFPVLIYGLILPSSYLCIQQKNSLRYFVNVKEYNAEDLIHLIEDVRKNLQ